MICRRYRPDDRAAVISVLRHSIPEWHGDWADPYWEWKFERNPHGEALIWVGEDDGRIAGCYIWNPVRIRLGTSTMLGAQSVDAATHSDYRGKGLFTDLARTAREDVAESELALVYAFPVEAAFRGQVRIGFEPRSTVTPVHRPLLLPLSRRKPGEFVLDTATSFDSEFDSFSAAKSDDELRVDRDAAYLRWRYDEHPTRTYETLVCRRAGELCGYCVLCLESTRAAGRAWTRGVGRGFILDLEVRPDAESAAAFLVHHALRHLRSRGARVAITWPRPSGLEQKALSDLGFSSRYHSIQRRLNRDHYEPQFLVYETETFRQLVDGSGPDPRWSLVPGDHDSM
jgi:GNAT superfamily N-acetyltransferase